VKKNSKSWCAKALLKGCADARSGVGQEQWHNFWRTTLTIGDRIDRIPRTMSYPFFIKTISGAFWLTPHEVLGICQVVWLVRVQKEQERKHYGNAFSSCGADLLFVYRSRTERGWGNWQETQSRCPTTCICHLSGRLLGSSLCGFPWPYLGGGRFLDSLADAPQRIRLVGQVVCLVRVQRNRRRWWTPRVIGQATCFPKTGGRGFLDRSLI